jgi:hypothetical protein
MGNAFAVVLAHRLLEQSNRHPSVLAVSCNDPPAMWREMVDMPVTKPAYGYSSLRVTFFLAAQRQEPVVCIRLRAPYPEQHDYSRQFYVWSSKPEQLFALIWDKVLGDQRLMRQACCDLHMCTEVDRFMRCQEVLELRIGEIPVQQAAEWFVVIDCLCPYDDCNSDILLGLTDSLIAVCA